MWMTTLLTCCLILTVPSLAADKIRIEIIETTSVIYLSPTRFPGSPEQINTLQRKRCRQYCHRRL